jgi:hypothetical protein
LCELVDANESGVAAETLVEMLVQADATLDAAASSDLTALIDSTSLGEEVVKKVGRVQAPAEQPRALF